MIMSDAPPRRRGRLRAWAQRLRTDVLALYLAARDPRTPLAPKLLAAAVAAYALSPIDLIPDFIPVLGALDDLIIVPLGIALAVRLIPPEILRECRARAAALPAPHSRAAAIVIVAVWMAVLLLVGAALLHGVL
jgi:uncharacterized membrane protein YkvA (DUF1232 family)